MSGRKRAEGSCVASPQVTDSPFPPQTQGRERDAFSPRSLSLQTALKGGGEKKRLRGDRPGERKSPPPVSVEKAAFYSPLPTYSSLSLPCDRPTQELLPPIAGQRREKTPPTRGCCWCGGRADLPRFSPHLSRLTRRQRLPPSSLPPRGRSHWQALHPKRRGTGAQASGRHPGFF